MAKLESLIISLEVETAELRKGLEELRGHTKEAAEAAEGLLSFEVLKEVGELATEAAEKLADFVLEGAEAADKMGKLAASAQVGAEEFQRLAFAAQLGGQSTEDLGSAFNKMNKALGEATQGSEKQVALFKALGVSITDSSGKAKSSADVFRELATKITEMGPGFAKADLEQQLFGKSGTALETTLKNVAEGMADAGGEADKLGLVLSDAAIKGATEFHDSIEKVKLAAGGVASRVAAELAPALTKLTDEFLNSKSGADLLKDAVTATVLVVKGLVTGVLAALEALNEFSISAIGIFTALALASHGEFSAASDALDNMKGMLDESADKFGQRMKDIWDSKPVLDFNENLKKAGEASEDVLKKQKGIEAATKAAAAAQKELSAALEQMAEHEFARTDRQAKNQFELDKKVEGINVGADKQRQSFQDIGVSPRDVAARTTAGFKDFNDALDKATANEIYQQEKLTEAKNLEADGITEGAQQAFAQAEFFGEGAEHAKKAMEGFRNIAEIDIKDTEESMHRVTATVEGLISKMLGKMGELGTVIQAGIEGFKQGGIWGALIAVLIELLSKFKRFQEVIDLGNSQVGDVLEQLKGGLGELVDGIKSVMTAASPLMRIITDMLNPLLRAVGHAFNMIGQILTPILSAMETGMETIAPIIDVFMSLLDALDPLKIAISVIAVVFNFISLVILAVMYGLEMAWIGILSVVHDILHGIGQNTSDVDKKLLDAIFAANKTKAQMTQVAEHLGDTNAAGDTPASKLDSGLNKVGDSATNAAKGLDKLSAAFTNVPEGFRTALRTFQATGAGGGGAGRQPGAWGPGSDVQVDANGNPINPFGNPTYNVTVQGSLIHESALTDLLQGRLAKSQFHKTGKGK